MITDIYYEIARDHFGYLPGATMANSDREVLELAERLRNENTTLRGLVAETARLDWMAQSYDDVGSETPETYLKATRTFERVFAAARKSGKPNSIAVREAIDAARKG